MVIIHYGSHARRADPIRAFHRAARAGCVVVPARPVAYDPVVVRSYVFAVY